MSVEHTEMKKNIKESQLSRHDANNRRTSVLDMVVEELPSCMQFEAEECKEIDYDQLEEVYEDGKIFYRTIHQQHL